MKIPVMPTLLGSALLFGLLIGHTPVLDLNMDCNGHWQNDPTRVCYDPNAVPPQDYAKDLGAMVEAVGDHDCLEPEVWHADREGEVPTWAVMRLLDGTIEGMPFDEAWAYAEGGKAWTLSLCADKES